jgi:hypothetical protein
MIDRRTGALILSNARISRDLTRSSFVSTPMGDRALALVDAKYGTSWDAARAFRVRRGANRVLVNVRAVPS